MLQILAKGVIKLQWKFTLRHYRLYTQPLCSALSCAVCCVSEGMLLMLSWAVSH